MFLILGIVVVLVFCVWLINEIIDGERKAKQHKYEREFREKHGYSCHINRPY